ncbi:polysaccharide biosynthesis tyrosine autokinase [Adhaeribacter swui]|uniref:non-specific protein-tyrosine kinase n=1 Tax=Adhaeribacter swui TaxID=2086471 RepID=A0A7G7G5A1_9BACT|nr:tyrosine-protein kinase [Adhaeribacter swui]QNF32335.1 polysaccharide biosynthesis tyrosine autokinase [Adhaeribacter swui]
MSTTQQAAQFTTFTLPAREAESFDIKKLVDKYLYHWPLFALGMVLSVVGAFYYLRVTDPTYEVKAALEFKDLRKTGVNTNNKNLSLNEIAPNTTKLVENEMELLKSRKLVHQVIMDLQLWVSYQHQDSVKNRDLYAITPVKLTFLKQPTTFTIPELEIQIKNKNSFILKEPDGKTKEYAFNSPIQNDLGNWQLKPTANLNWFIGSEIKIIIQDPDIVSDAYQRNLKVSMENKLAPFVSLAINEQVPQRGRDFLNTLLETYSNDAVNQKNNETQKNLNFINSRIDSLAKELSRTEEELEDFRSSQGITDISSESKVYLDNVQANENKLNEATVQLNVIQGIQNHLNSPQNKNTVPSLVGIADEGLVQLLQKLSDFQSQRDQMLATTPEANPIFEPIDLQIKTTKEAINEKIENIKSSFLTTQKQLQAFNQKFEGSIKKLPGQERQLIVLQREQASKEKLYTYLLEKKEEVALSYASILSDVRIVDDAHAGPVKWPQIPMVLGIALLLGLVAPAGFIYARENLNDKIISRQDIENEVDVPILAELSHQNSKEAIVVTNGRGNFAIGEQFRTLRTNLYHVHNHNEGGRVTLITSSTGGEGKSFVSTNLGVVLAHSDRKTVILEMDLRKPKVSQAFKISLEQQGISDFLNGQAALEDIIQASGIANLDIIGCGSILPNPSELLEKTKLDDLILILKNWYDDIIIDSPPIHLVTDAVIISRVADVTLYIVRQGFTRKIERDFIKQVFKSKKMPNMKIVFNGIQGEKFGYGYNYDDSYYNSYNPDVNKPVTRFKKFFNRF